MWRWSSSNAGALGNAEYPFIAIVPRSTLFICIKMDWALNNLQWLICYKTKPIWSFFFFVNFFRYFSFVVLFSLSFWSFFLSFSHLFILSLTPSFLSFLIFLIEDSFIRSYFSSFYSFFLSFFRTFIRSFILSFFSIICQVVSLSLTAIVYMFCPHFFIDKHWCFMFLGNSLPSWTNR